MHFTQAVNELCSRNIHFAGESILPSKFIPTLVITTTYFNKYKYIKKNEGNTLQGLVLDNKFAVISKLYNNV